VRDTKTEKCTKLSQNVPNGRKISQNVRKMLQMAIKYISIFESKALKNFSQIGISDLKINHLAILVVSHSLSFSEDVLQALKVESQTYAELRPHATVRMVVPGLPDGLFSNQKSKFG
jgi:hypothetical protein